MHDIVIHNATVVDGTGAPPFHGDVAITGDRIAEVTPRLAHGEAPPPGRREIDAGRPAPLCGALFVAVPRKPIVSMTATDAIQSML